MSATSPFDRSRAPAPGPVRPFGLPEVHRSALDNGLSVLAARHGRLPVVTAALVLEGGAAGDPPAKAGLAYLVAGALDAGTRRRSADDLAWELERLGVEFEADPRWDGVILSIVAPRERLELALDLFAEIVREPAFPLEEIDRLRNEQLAEILQRQKEPRALAADMAARFIFGQDVPYCRPLLGTSLTVRGLGPVDVEGFYRGWYAPRGAALLMVGDIDADAARDLARARFGDWTGEPHPRPAFEVSRAVERATVFIVDRPGSVQSELRVGDVGLARSHEDYFPLQVMNALLGGAFTSRLNMSLRERHGFTYGVHSGFAFRRQPGPFQIQTAVATDVTARAVEEILREVHRLRDEAAPDEEVAAARDYLAGTLPLELQTTDQLAARLADLVLYDLPDDYFDTYRERILAVTPADVQRVARAHLRPERFALVVVGDARAIAPPLEALGAGPVEVHHVEAEGSPA
jgi:zinc protease